MPDMPIVYCSEPFELLTGYTSREIIGRNCRFLQSPDGKVDKGAKRKHTDDKTVFDLMTRISAKEAAQMTIVNYKKGGIPFENILTTIPIRWDGEDMRFILGFQVDRRKVDPACFPRAHVHT
jgi:PAS domain-containing protein